MTVERHVSFVVNGQRYEVEVEPRVSLADALRTELGLTGTHLGCEHGMCGACTIWLDGQSIRSCLMFAVQAEGAELTTIEGMGTPASMHPLQEAFSEYHALQCGFCTPGMIMAAADLLRHNQHPTESDIKDWLGGNICRCTGYENIVRAVQAVSDGSEGDPDWNAAT